MPLVNRLACVRCEVRPAIRQVKTQLTPHLIHLTYEAALRSFWRTNVLSSFLSQAAVPRLPSWLSDDSTRNYLARVFEILERTDRAIKLAEAEVQTAEHEGDRRRRRRRRRRTSMDARVGTTRQALTTRCVSPFATGRFGAESARPSTTLSRVSPGR